MKPFVTVVMVIVVIVLLLLVVFIFLYKNTIDREYILERISNSDYCKTVDDCVLINEPCNLVGCGVAVNKRDAPKIEYLLSVYNFPYGAYCGMDCSGIIGVDCIINRCKIIS